MYNQPFLSPKALRDGQRPSWGKCKKRILQNALNLYQNTYIICRFIGFYWCVIEVLRVSGITKVLFQKGFLQRWFRTCMIRGVPSNTWYTFLFGFLFKLFSQWCNLRCSSGAESLELVILSRGKLWGEAVGFAATKLCVFLFILRLVNLGLTNYGFTGIFALYFLAQDSKRLWGKHCSVVAPWAGRHLQLAISVPNLHICRMSSCAAAANVCCQLS